VPSEQKSIPQVLSELWEMLVSYAKQETVEPLKGLFRFIGVGVAAMLLLGVGVLLMSISVLRLLQTKEPFGWELSGSLNFIPYVVSLVVLGALIGLAVLAIKPKRSKTQ
jgi:hypothetical protein